MRLIDADNFKGKVIASHCYSGVNRLKSINDVPTAYDVNKVIEELKEMGNKYCKSVECNGECDCCEHASMMQGVIKIVKGGGIDGVHIRN
ncbi:MAG: hypothetical protein ACLRR3_15520 [Eubacterium sp.]